MARDKDFTIVIPSRNAPERCVQIVQEFFFAADIASFDYHLKLVFLLNDTDAALSDQLETTIAESKIAPSSVTIIRSDRDYPTVEENVRNNLPRHLDKISDRFIIIGNSDVIDYSGLSAALHFMEERRVDLQLVGVINSESWEGQIVRSLNTTPRFFHRTNLLPAENCAGPEVFGLAMLDYGPADYIAYLGCHIYTKKFFLDACSVKIGEPLYSLPLATAEVAERKTYNTGFFHGIVANRIDALELGPDDPGRKPGWWIEATRTSRGYSALVNTALITGSRDISDTTFARMVKSHMVSIPRSFRTYVFWDYIVSLTEAFVKILTKPPADDRYIYTNKEVDDFLYFSQRLRQVDLGMPDALQDKLCSWYDRFGLYKNTDDPDDLQDWVETGRDVLEAISTPPFTGIWVARKAL